MHLVPAYSDLDTLISLLSFEPASNLQYLHAVEHARRGLCALPSVLLDRRDMPLGILFHGPRGLRLTATSPDAALALLRFLPPGPQDVRMPYWLGDAVAEGLTVTRRWSTGVYTVSPSNFRPSASILMQPISREEALTTAQDPGLRHRLEEIRDEEWALGPWLGRREHDELTIIVGIITACHGAEEIGALYTAEAWRNRGYARAAVSALTTGIFDRGHVPSYRYIVGNEASRHVAVALGYHEAGRTAGIEFINE